MNRTPPAMNSDAPARPSRALALLLLLAAPVVGLIVDLQWSEPAPEPSPDPDGGSATTEFSFGLLVIQLFPSVAPVLAISLAVAFAAHGGRGVRAAWDFVLRRAEASALVAAAATLRTAAWAALGAGVVLGLGTISGGFAMAWSVVNDGVEFPAPARAAYLVTDTIFAPATALFVGRVVLGGLAESAALASGARGERRRVFTAGADLALLGVLFLAVCLFFLVTARVD